MRRRAAASARSRPAERTAGQTRDARPCHVALLGNIDSRTKRSLLGPEAPQASAVSHESLPGRKTDPSEEEHLEATCRVRTLGRTGRS